MPSTDFEERVGKFLQQVEVTSFEPDADADRILTTIILSHFESDEIISKPRVKMNPSKLRELFLGQALVAMTNVTMTDGRGFTVLVEAPPQDSNQKPTIAWSRPMIQRSLRMA